MPDRSPQDNAFRQTILLVTGLSGAGSSTALRALQDMGWETVDNLPIRLLGPLLATPPVDGSEAGERPLAIGIDSRTRGLVFSAAGRDEADLRNDFGTATVVAAAGYGA